MKTLLTFTLFCSFCVSCGLGEKSSILNDNSATDDSTDQASGSTDEVQQDDYYYGLFELTNVSSGVPMHTRLLAVRVEVEAGVPKILHVANVATISDSSNDLDPDMITVSVVKRDYAYRAISIAPTKVTLQKGEGNSYSGESESLKSNPADREIYKVYKLLWSESAEDRLGQLYFGHRIEHADGSEEVSAEYMYNKALSRFGVKKNLTADEVRRSYFTTAEYYSITSSDLTTAFRIEIEDDKPRFLHIKNNLELDAAPVEVILQGTDSLAEYTGIHSGEDGEYTYSIQWGEDSITINISVERAGHVSLSSNKHTFKRIDGRIDNAGTRGSAWEVREKYFTSYHYGLYKLAGMPTSTSMNGKSIDVAIKIGSENNKPHTMHIKEVVSDENEEAVISDTVNMYLRQILEEADKVYRGSVMHIKENIEDLYDQYEEVGYRLVWSGEDSNFRTLGVYLPEDDIAEWHKGQPDLAYDAMGIGEKLNDSAEKVKETYFSEDDS